MKQKIRNTIARAAEAAFSSGNPASAGFPEIELEEPKIEAHGDFSTNLCMVMAKQQKMPPRRIAEAILGHLEDPEGIIEKTEIAGPGFVNFFLKPAFWHPVLAEIEQKDTAYGASDIGRGTRVQVEFVSANPTGPLHVGHGRGAAVGDCVAGILAFCGYDVRREYYINDSGRQIRTLGLSVYLRYRERFEQAAAFPGDCYQGDYIRDLSAAIASEKGRALLDMDEAKATEFCARYAAADILNGIRKDLSDFGVRFDQWFSEQGLYDSGKVDETLRNLETGGLVYEKDGARWFRTSDFGDEKDRVVVRNNGLTTYFASDIAYHMDKFARGFERVIDVWGADHHGYIPRIKACIAARGHGSDRLDVILVHLVNLLRGGVPVAMSTRSGEFVTLREVVDEVGRDAARFIFLTRHHESPLDFDLELAKQKTNENPVYYVQYVHARICSIQRKAEEEGRIDVNRWDAGAVSRLVAPEEIRVLKELARYPETVALAAAQLEPHRITFHLMSLASAFHSFYNRHRVLEEDPVLAKGRMCLIRAVATVIRNGLMLLGVSAPEKM